MSFLIFSLFFPFSCFFFFISVFFLLLNGTPIRKKKSLLSAPAVQMTPHEAQSFFVFKVTK